jgi:nitrate reductase delta subunit
MPLAELQERYSDAFDFNPSCTLDLGWHLFGESHERGAFMAALLDDMAGAGLAATAELPDHLTNVLALLAREAPDRAAMLADIVEPAVTRVHRALAEAGNPYADLLGATLEALSTVPGRVAPVER